MEKGLAVRLIKLVTLYSIFVEIRYLSTKKKKIKKKSVNEKMIRKVRLNIKLKYSKTDDVFQ